MTTIIGVAVGWALNTWRLHRKIMKRRDREDARFVAWLEGLNLRE